jgi:hypothetical protein
VSDGESATLAGQCQRGSRGVVYRFAVAALCERRGSPYSQRSAVTDRRYNSETDTPPSRAWRQKAGAASRRGKIATFQVATRRVEKQNAFSTRNGDASAGRTR